MDWFLGRVTIRSALSIRTDEGVAEASPPAPESALIFSPQLKRGHVMFGDFIMRNLTKGSGALAFLLIGAASFGFSAHALGSGTQNKQKEPEHKEAKLSIADPREGHATLWKEPAAIESLDLFYGSGGREGAPDASATFTFIRRSTSGTSKKIIVKGDKDRQWSVKFGPEARPE